MARPKNVLLDAELNPDAYPDDAPEGLTSPSLPAPVSVTPAVASPPTAGVDLAALIQGLTQALTNGVTGAIEQARPARHSREDHEYERISHYNSVGDALRPRQSIQPTYPVYWAVINEADESQPPVPLYEFDYGTMTYDELVALQSFTPGKYLVELNDGKQEPLVCYEKKDIVSGTRLSLLISLRKHCFAKDRRNMVPNLRRLAQQIAAPVTAV